MAVNTDKNGTRTASKARRMEDRAKSWEVADISSLGCFIGICLNHDFKKGERGIPLSPFYYSCEPVVMLRFDWRNIGLDRAIEDGRQKRFHVGFDFSRNLAIQIMEWGIARRAKEETAGEGAFFG